MDAKIFEAYSRYYDLLYKDKDYKGETAYAEGLIRRFGRDAKSILELGCGTGIHASLLAEKGYTVQGIDRSETMLRRALERQAALPAAVSEKLSFLQGDARTFASSRSYDAVISLFHVMSYMAENEDLSKTIQTAKKHLNTNGLFIFDCWHGPAVLHDLPVSRTKAFESDAVSIKRVSVPEIFHERNLVDVSFDIVIHDKAAKQDTRLKEVHRMRYLFTEELKSLLDIHGLDMIHAEEWMSGQPLSEKTWNACYVCRHKPKA